MVFHKYIGMDDVKFKYRLQYPSEVKKGYFYWVQEQENNIYFAPTDNPGDMILLSYVFDDSQISQWTSKISGLEGKVEGIQEILNEMGEELKQYLTSSDLDDYVNRKELQEILDGFTPDIGDSDLDIIAEKVTEKVKLTWKVI